MKAIKNINGLKRSLRAHDYTVVEDNGVDMVIILKPNNLSIDNIVEDLRKIFLETHRVSYLDVFSNGQNIVVDVCFY